MQPHTRDAGLLERHRLMATHQRQAQLNRPSSFLQTSGSTLTGIGLRTRSMELQSLPRTSIFGTSIRLHAATSPSHATLPKRRPMTPKPAHQLALNRKLASSWKLRSCLLHSKVPLRLLLELPMLSLAIGLLSLLSLGLRHVNDSPSLSLSLSLPLLAAALCWAILPVNNIIRFLYASPPVCRCPCVAPVFVDGRWSSTRDRASGR
ncbi:hypothetical protein BC831DRAFT_153098 [Entophlyctis helioformis]|nr:hypothetical protein BC831DRAFT_153098 [Entophlyctis helioformis]